MAYRIDPEYGISDFYYCDRRTDHSIFAHTHSHVEFIFVMTGKMVITIDDVTHELTENEGVIIMPYEVHSYSIDSKSNIFILACPPDYINEYRRMLIDKAFSPPITGFGSATRLQIEDIISSEFKDDFKKKSLIYYTLSEFSAHCTMVDKPPLEFDTYRKAIAYISSNYTRDLSLEEVAGYVGVTASHLSRIINGGRQTSFSDILNSLRIYHARKLLLNSDISISDAAFESGFGSIRNFNRIFRKYFGSTPKDARELNQ